MMSVSIGLPYHHYWDEPQTVSGALVAMKENAASYEIYSTLYSRKSSMVKSAIRGSR